MSDKYAEAIRLGREADALYHTDVDRAMALYRDAWDACPEPKLEWDGVTWVWGMIAGEQIKRRQFHDAIASLQHVEQSVYKNNDSGTPYHLGVCYYELGDKEAARRYFERAWGMSEGRAFRTGDVKYARFLKEKPPMQLQ